MEVKSDDKSFAQDLINIAQTGGAKDAVMISTEQIVIDPRVRLKCLVPPCSLSGICKYCPP